MRGLATAVIGTCLLLVPLVAQEGTASLAGIVKSITGTGISGTLGELWSERGTGSYFRTTADSAGVFRFSGLPADEYFLKLGSSGFKSLTVKSIHISEGEQKSIAALQLAVSGCGGYATLDYIRPLSSGDHLGNLVGSVSLDQGPKARKIRKIADADVTLVCSTGKVCGSTRTDLNGDFRFDALPSGDFWVRVNRAGFYALNQSGYKISEGLESLYWPVYLERCPLGNCHPRLRPKKPRAFCE
jgi:hypothetical protein